MIILIIGDKQTFRREHIEQIVSSLSGSEVIVSDDTYGSIADLERYMYPSLFTPIAPIVHLKFILNPESDALTTGFLKKLLASPTMFMFEEMAVAAPVVSLFKKAGAVVHIPEKTRAVKKEGDIFAVARALTAPDKKGRWIAYREALAHHAIEAIVGILYWKVRDLMSKSGKDAETYRVLYKELLRAHAKAWESGAPLELMIEKVILSQ